MPHDHAWSSRGNILGGVRFRNHRTSGVISSRGSVNQLMQPAILLSRWTIRWFAPHRGNPGDPGRVAGRRGRSSGGAKPRRPAGVGNYVTALEYGLERLDILPLSLRLMREMHERLMRGVRGNVATPGEFRRQPELDRTARMHAGQRHLCPAAALGTHDMPGRLGAVPA